MSTWPKPQNRAVYKSLTTLAARASHRSLERPAAGLLPFTRARTAARAPTLPVPGVPYPGASTGQIHTTAAAWSGSGEAERVPIPRGDDHGAINYQRRCSGRKPPLQTEAARKKQWA